MFAVMFVCYCIQCCKEPAGTSQLTRIIEEVCLIREWVVDGSEADDV